MAPDNFKGEFVGLEGSYCSKCMKETEHKVEIGTQKKGASDETIKIRKYSCNICSDFKYELLDKIGKGQLLTDKNKKRYLKRVFGYFMLIGYFIVVWFASILNFFERRFGKVLKRS